MAVIETRALAKAYGAVQALRGVTLAVEKGEIYGLLGRNGAGKTTFVKILLSIVHRGGGDARLLGEAVPHTASRRRVGYLPEDNRLPDYHTGRSALDFYGSLSEVPGRERRRRILELLDLVELKDDSSRKIRTYSKGMKQRLGLAQALLHDPEVLFLDEPTDGVDPVGRKRIRDLLMLLKGRGRTIFLNSHLLGEVEQVCDRVGILVQGRLVREGRPEELCRVTNVYEIDLDGSVAAAWEELMALAPVARKVGHFLELELDDPRKLDAVIDLLRAKGIGVRGISEKRRSLEDVFMETVAEPERPA